MLNNCSSTSEGRDDDAGSVSCSISLPAACCLLMLPSAHAVCDNVTPHSVVPGGATKPLPASAGQSPQSLCVPEGVLYLDRSFLSFRTERIERVTVTGNSMLRDWKTVCIGQECEEVLGMEAAASRINDVLGGWWNEVVDILLPLPEVRACAVLTADPGTYKTTSHDNDEDRRKAGSDLLVQVIARGGNSIGMNGRKVAVTYSDGGTETYVYVVANPRISYIAIPSDLKKGDGVSRCPR